MSKRSPLPNSKSSDQKGVPPMLMDALEKLGRTRGSSATPVQSRPLMLSPQPQQDIQARIDSLTNEMGRTTIIQGEQDERVVPASRRGPQLHSQGGYHHRRGNSSTARSGNSNQNNGLGYGNTDRDTTFNIQQSASTRRYTSSISGPGTFKFPAGQDSSKSGNQPRTPSQWAALFQEKLAEAQHMVSKDPDIPKDIQEFFTREIQKIAQEFNDSQRRMQQEWDRLKNERDDLRRQLQHTKGDNSRLLQERKTLELKHQQSSERWKRSQEDLLQQIAVQKEQLGGKRALWMEVNPGSSARRDAMDAIRDPFSSPTTNQTLGYQGSVMGSMVSPSITTPAQNSFSSSNLGPPPTFKNMAQYLAGGINARNYGTGGWIPGFAIDSVNQNGATRSSSHTIQRRTGSLPTTTLLTSPYLHSTAGYDKFGRSQTYPTEPATEVDFPSTALILHRGHDQLAAEYKAAISKLYDMVENWVSKYSNEPCMKNDRAIASGNSILWDYMMNCTYPGHRQDAHTHVVALLGDVTTRYWFVMRMATQYCVKDIMSIEAFKPYSKVVDKIISEMLSKLQERGLNNEARQQYIDKGSRAVQSVSASKDYQLFRAQQLNIHTKALRDILGPMLNDDVVRSEAGKELGAIAIHSWELSVKMHTAHLTFQIYFPETASKFTAATMTPKDRLTDPMQLQVQQVRVKLVITPVITMRDDKGTTIKAKAIHSSNVLLMS